MLLVYKWWCMELYIEYVILDNVLIDIYILSMMRWTMSLRPNRYRRLAFFAISIISALIVPYVYLYANSVLILYKLFAFLLMTLVLKKYRSIGEYIIHIFVSILFTSLIAGLCYGILIGFGLKTQNNALFIFDTELPMSIVILVLYGVMWLIKMCIVYIYKNIKKQKYLYNIELIDNGQKVKAIGYYDSGNCVENSNNGVSIVSINLFQKLHNDISIVDLLSGKENIMLKNMKYISIDSIGGSKKYLSCMIDAIRINDITIHNPYLAITYKDFGNFDVILHKDILGGIK